MKRNLLAGEWDRQSIMQMFQYVETLHLQELGWYLDDSQEKVKSIFIHDVSLTPEMMEKLLDRCGGSA